MSKTNDMGHRYRCSRCGSQAIVTKPGSGRLACCGVELEDLTDAARSNDSGAR